MRPAYSHRYLLNDDTPGTIITYRDATWLPPNSTADGGGAMLFPGRVALGTQLAAAATNVLPSLSECISACRDLEQCTSFLYCELQGGCINPEYNLSAPQGGCELVRQEVTQPGTGRPVLTVADDQFVGGAPLRFAAQPVEGYESHPGLGFWYRYDFACNGSVSQPGSCGLAGGPGANAPQCNASETCQVIMYFPRGRDYPGPDQPVVLLKGAEGVRLDVLDANVNLNAVLYMKTDLPDLVAPADGGGGLVVGAIVGIAAGAACVVAAGVAALILVAQRRRRQREEEDLGVLAKGFPAPSSRWPGSTVPSLSSTYRGSELLFAASVASGSGPVRLCATCPPTPAPSAAGSSAADRPPPATTAKLPPIVPGRAPPPGHSPSPPGARTPLAAAAAAPVSPRSRLSQTSAAAHPLLAHLPTVGWQSCMVDYSTIRFATEPDGSLVELGVGAFATVYKVLLNGFDPHAAKVFRLGKDAETQLYFLEEVGLLRQLRHKSIVNFAGVCVADGYGLILMELMEGGDLRRRSTEVDEYGRRVFGWYQRGKTVALDVACAILYLHSSGYTHFDIKSRNVLLSRDQTAKLADVGFTRAMRATHHSIEGPTGTFDYMAPELLTGKKVNNAADIFSFGVLLWELVTGKYPMRGDMRDPRVPQECPKSVAQLISECMREDSSRRPTAAQLVARLTKLQ